MNGIGRPEFDLVATASGGGSPVNLQRPVLPDRLKTEPFRRLGILDLPREDFVVAGSAPLFIRGLREQVSDLDIVVRGDVWRRAKSLGDVRRAPYGEVLSISLTFPGIRIEILDGWFPPLFGTVDRLITRAEAHADGLRFLSLLDTVKWKYYLDRPKDRDDLRRIGMNPGGSHPRSLDRRLNAVGTPMG